MNNYDVVVVGAGIIGLSIAWQVARRSGLRVLVLEKGAGLGEGSTGASSAICRHRYSLDEMVELARDGIDAYRHWQDYVQLSEPRAQFQADGVLWMPGENRAWADGEHARLQRFGIPTAVLDDTDLQRRFPAISPCIRGLDLQSGKSHPCQGGGRNLLELTGGYVDPMAAAQDLIAACRNAGVTIRFKARVTGVDTHGAAIRGVSLADGKQFHTPLVINAAGPWCGELNTAAGLRTTWDLAPVRIQVLYLDRPAEIAGDLPVTADFKGGIYFRTQNRGQQLLVSSVLEEDEKEVVADPDHYDVQHDDEFQLVKLHALKHRLPALPFRGRVRGYCGLYTVNRDDVHPIVGPTAIRGFWVANGFSGHGFKLAPVIGSMVARELTGEAREFDTRLPISLFSIDRKPIQIASRSVLA